MTGLSEDKCVCVCKELRCMYTNTNTHTNLKFPSQAAILSDSCAMAKLTSVICRKLRSSGPAAAVRTVCTPVAAVLEGRGQEEAV